MAIRSPRPEPPQGALPNLVEGPAVRGSPTSSQAAVVISERACAGYPQKPREFLARSRVVANYVRPRRRVGGVNRLTNRPTVSMLSDGPRGSTGESCAAVGDTVAVRATLDG